MSLDVETQGLEKLGLEKLGLETQGASLLVNGKFQAAGADIVKKFGLHERDTGSVAVQVALITSKVNELQEHFGKHVKDHHSRRGLLKLVSRRRSLLDYLKREDVKAYRDLIQSLGLRK